MPSPNYNYTALTELLNGLKNPKELVCMLERVEACYLELQDNVPITIPELSNTIALLSKLIDALHESIS